MIRTCRSSVHAHARRVTRAVTCTPRFYSTQEPIIPSKLSDDPQKVEIDKEHAEEHAWKTTAEAKAFLDAAQVDSAEAFLPRDMKEYMDTKSFPASSVGRRLFSSLLTFPLSLSYSLRFLFPPFKVPRISVLLIGARSESSLPRVWWRNTLVTTSNCDNLDVAMIGPHLQEMLRQKKNEPVSFEKPLLSELGFAGSKMRVQYVPNGKTALHDHPDCMRLLMESDLFVLFNPGFGSKPLREEWAPTMKLLLETRKPILATAHSEKDVRRDLDMLDRLSTEEDLQDLGEPLEFLIPPHENPFASTRRTYDACEEEGAQVVQANRFLYAFQSK